eukprot:TRINITY_DN4457_c0_g1_i2.p1 TRINITY_DN4457_c0_g1~~TRINITY_DN4457_c0_g1_i2.p1  ORF type:complete len:379 (-),score=67.38 TRINITY_DN4457_c0_g1_i2:780-1916(-)
MAKWEHDEDPYSVLGIELNVDNKADLPTNEEVKKAYRRQAKEKHPDKNPDNPNAKDEFDLLKRALDFLLDENKRNVWLAEARSRAFHHRKRKAQKESKRRMVEDLERRESEFVQQLKRQKSEQQSVKEKLLQEKERLQRQMQRQAEQAFERRKKEEKDELQEQLSRSFKVSWDRRSGEYSGQQLREIFKDCGEIEDVIITTSKKKKGSALITMKSSQSLSKVQQSQGHFGDVNNPLLITISGKHKQQQTQPNKGIGHQPFTYTGFRFRNQEEQAGLQQHDDCQQHGDSQQKYHGQPLFPVTQIESDQQQSHNKCTPLFPINQSTVGDQDVCSEERVVDSQRNQRVASPVSDSVWNLDEIDEDQDLEYQVKTTPLFPIQ